MDSAAVAIAITGAVATVATAAFAQIMTLRTNRENQKAASLVAQEAFERAARRDDQRRAADAEDAAKRHAADLAERRLEKQYRARAAVERFVRIHHRLGTGLASSTVRDEVIEVSALVAEAFSSPKFARQVVDRILAPAAGHRESVHGFDTNEKAVWQLWSEYDHEMWRVIEAVAATAGYGKLEKPRSPLLTREALGLQTRVSTESTEAGKVAEPGGLRVEAGKDEGPADDESAGPDEPAAQPPVKIP